MNEHEPLDFLAIGDIVTDAFIKLSDAWASEPAGERPKGLCVRLGDKVPFDEVEVKHAVGNAANAACAASRLGLRVGFATWLGDDQTGRDCLEELAREKIDPRYVTVEPGKPTNYHYVLRLGAERTILIKHTAFDYKLPSVEPGPKWLYLSSFAPTGAHLHDQVDDYLDAHPETKLAFQPGVFDIKQGVERLARHYRRAAFFVCNKEEAERILQTAPLPIPELLPKVRALGPKVVAITDGPNGAYAQGDDGVVYSVPMFPDDAEPISRTGAGDAFASTVTAALALGLPLQEALRWGPVNSAAVVQKVGAHTGLLSRAELESRLAAAPAEYRVETVS